MITAFIYDTNTGVIRTKMVANHETILANTGAGESYSIAYDSDDVMSKPDFDLLNADLSDIEIIDGEVHHVVR